jgi:hypothetical protein
MTLSKNYEFSELRRVIIGLGSPFTLADLRRFADP